MATIQTTTTTALSNAAIFASKPNPSTAKPPETRPRPYKDFLTPALHRRFTRAAALVVATCYLTSILMAPPSILWIWNPLSATGIRTLLLFMPCLAVFIVHVTNMHVGARTTTCAAETAWEVLCTWKAGYTAGWYVFSACFFGEIYLWSRRENANLGWVDPGRIYQGGLWERPVLNENPVFLRSVWLCLALAQAALHLSRDEDRIDIPATDQQPEQQPELVSKVPRSLKQLGERLPAILDHTIRLLLPGLALTFPLYLIFLRHLLWPTYHFLGGIFFNHLTPNSRPTGLQHGVQLTWQTLTSSLLLILLWELSSAIFSIFIARPPLRRGTHPLTSEVKDASGNLVSRSRDPNGSLLSGLKSKNGIFRSFAFWELSLICAHHDTRRKTIYTEVDRAGGSTWSQISQLCIDEIAAIQTRIKDASAPPPAPSHQHAQPQDPLTLPKIADRTVIPNGAVLQNPPKHNRLDSFARSIPQSPGGANPVIPRARKAIEWSADHLLSKDEQARLAPSHLSQEANGVLAKLAQSPLGEPFRQTFARRVCKVVFSSPCSRQTSIAHASQALGILCVKSLGEDDYAQVAGSIARVVRVYTETISAVSGFLGEGAKKAGVSGEEGRVKEVEEVLDVLKAGLEGVLLTFGEYADAVGVTRKELREAREALGRGLEMRVV